MITMKIQKYGSIQAIEMKELRKKSTKHMSKSAMRVKN